MFKIMRKLVAFVFVCMSFYSVLQAQSICGGSSFTITPTSTLTNPTGYTLNPGGFTPANGVFVVSPSTTTTYTILSSNSSTTIGSSVITVTVNPQPNSVVTQTQSTCTSSNNAVSLGLTFSPATPPPAYTLSWTPIPASVLSPQQFTATNLTPGPYTVVATTAAGCSLVINFTVNPQPTAANFTVIPFGGIHSITCVTSTVDLSASSSNSNITYTWSGASFTPVISPSISLTNLQLGTFTVTGLDPTSNCSTTYTFVLGQNIAVPSSTLSTTSIPINCTQSVAPTLTATANPSVNVSHFIYAPTGGTFVAASYTTIYTNFSPGTYTHVVVNNVNGCFTTDHFTVTSSDNYPIYGVSSPNSFTLGCASKSVGIINIINAATTPSAGGPVSYTLLSPGSSSVLPAGPLTGPASYTNITVPGTWTVVVRDNTNFCDTRTPISVTQNILGPNLIANVPLQVLDCNTKKVVLEALSETPNVGYLWTFTTSGTPGNVAGNTITVNTNPIAATTTVINIYTLTITDNNNSCKSTSLIPMYQNTFPPTTSITGGANFLTCISPTIVLTNQSRTGIPLAAIFPTNQPVIGFLWEGPSPQEPLQVNSTYTAATVGIYTLTGKDLNNGCISKGNYTITDNRVAPVILSPSAPIFIDCGANGALLSPTITTGGATGNLTYTWAPPTGTSTANSFTQATIFAGTPGIYSITVRNSINGCVTKSSVEAITGSLTAKFDPDKTTGFAPLTVNFTNSSFSSNGNDNITAIYSYGNGTRSGSVSPTGSFIPVPISSTVIPQVIYTHPGTYTVTLFVKKGVCIDTTYKVIKVEIPSSLEVPNVFTPNNDGINDIYFLKAANIVQINMVIYDRWGHIVYEIDSDTGNVEWDGKNAQGKEAAEGVYFYLLKTVGKDGETRDQKGTINLYR
jgi:gliding motility-associated-like protein